MDNWATEMVSNAIAQGDVQAINYFIAQKYVEALKEFAHSPNQKLMILPTEITGVMGSIAGIAELAKESLHNQQAAIAAKPPRTKIEHSSINCMDLRPGQRERSGKQRCDPKWAALRGLTSWRMQRRRSFAPAAPKHASDCHATSRT